MTAPEQQPAPPPPPAPPSIPGRFAGPAVAALVLSIAAEVAVALVLRCVLDAPVLVTVAAIGVALYGVLVLTARRIAGQLAASARQAFGFAVEAADAGRGLLVFVFMFVVSVAVAGPVYQRTGYRGQNTGLFDRFRHRVGAYVFLTVLTVVVAPVVEELFFRGVLLRALNDRIGPRWGNPVQALLFGLVHIQPLQGAGNLTIVVTIGVGGLVLGWSANRYASLGPGIVAHALRNALTMVIVLVR